MALQLHSLQQFLPAQSTPQQLKAWQRLCAVGLPRPRSENFTWIAQHKFRLEDFAPVSKPEATSPVTRLPAHCREIRGQTPHVEKEKDALALGCLSFANQSQYFSVKANGAANDPMVIHLPTLKSGLGESGILGLRLEAGAVLELELHGPQTAHTGTVNWLLDIQLAAGACLRIFEKLAPTKGHVFLRWIGTLATEAKADFLSADLGGDLHRSSHHWILSGEHAHCALRGISLVHGENQSHRHILLEHEAARCNSRQFFRHILYDKGQTSLDGSVHVLKNTADTFSEQLVNTLLLSPGARAGCKPNLRIFHDGVKCSHGHTCGELDTDELFYLHSRGISPETARSMLLQAFIANVLAEHPQGTQRNLAGQLLQENLHAL